MEVEIGRINLFDNFTGISRTAFRIFLFGLLVVAGGLLLSSSIIADIGWAVSAISMFTWLAASLLKNVFASRIPFEMLDK
jgi:hypothetical protein